MTDIDPLLTPLKIIFDYMDGDINLEDAVTAMQEADPDMTYKEVKELLLQQPRDNVMDIQLFRSGV